jgi:hypothetical protein
MLSLSLRFTERDVLARLRKVRSHVYLPWDGVIKLQFFRGLELQNIKPPAIAVTTKKMITHTTGSRSIYLSSGDLLFLYKNE